MRKTSILRLFISVFEIKKKSTNYYFFDLIWMWITSLLFIVAAILNHIIPDRSLTNTHNKTDKQTAKKKLSQLTIGRGSFVIGHSIQLKLIPHVWYYLFNEAARFDGWRKWNNKANQQNENSLNIHKEKENKNHANLYTQTRPIKKICLMN